MLDCQSRRGGFTLIELLVVIAILGILGALGVTMLRSSQADAEELQCKATIQTLTTALEQYKSDRRHGAYPLTSLEGKPGAGKLTNRINLGAESLFVALASKDFRGDRPSESLGDDSFENTDGDVSAKPLTIYGSKDLFEFLDPWGNPFAYFNAADYGNPAVRRYMAASTVGGEYEIVTVKPWENAKTKSPFRPSSYQIFSAGPDMTFNTEDDIGNW